MALVVSLVVISVVLTLTYSFFTVTLGAQRRSAGDLDDQRAFLLADAGLHEAYEALRGGADGNLGTVNLPVYLGGGVFWVEANDLGGNMVELKSTALIGAGRHALQVTVRNDALKSPLFETTLNSKATLTLNEGVLIDSYDSAKGTYAAQAVNVNKNGQTYAGLEGHARSNQDIIINANATVMGDAVPGPGRVVSQAPSSYVYGNTTPSPDPFAFPAVAIPSYPPSSSVSVPNFGTVTLAAGSYEMPSVSIGRAATLVVKGPATIVVDDFTGGKDANLVVDATNGPVTFHVRNTYTHTRGFEVAAAPGSPAAVAFMIQGTKDIVFPSDTAIRGAYYAPNANILFSSNNECWGAFAGGGIVMSNSMRFHYDVNLMNYWKENTGSSPDPFEVVSWEETNVEPRSWLADRRDPLEVLGVNKNALPSPSAAWVKPVKP